MHIYLRLASQVEIERYILAKVSGESSFMTQETREPNHVMVGTQIEGRRDRIQSTKGGRESTLHLYTGDPAEV